MTRVSLDDAVLALAEFGPNCLLGICCPPSEQRNVLATLFVERCGLDEAFAAHAAEWVLAHFDLAPKDSITPLLRLAGQLAKDGTP